MDVRRIAGDEAAPYVHRRHCPLLDREARGPARLLDAHRPAQCAGDLFGEGAGDLRGIGRISLAGRVQQAPPPAFGEGEEHQRAALGEQPVHAVAREIGVHLRVRDQPGVRGVALEAEAERLAHPRVPAVAAPQVAGAHRLDPPSGVVRVAVTPSSSCVKVSSSVDHSTLTLSRAAAARKMRSRITWSRFIMKPKRVGTAE